MIPILGGGVYPVVVCGGMSGGKKLPVLAPFA